jgi:hypothetical protein
VIEVGAVLAGIAVPTFALLGVALWRTRND